MAELLCPLSCPCCSSLMADLAPAACPAMAALSCCSEGAPGGLGPTTPAEPGMGPAHGCGSGHPKWTEGVMAGAPRGQGLQGPPASPLLCFSADAGEAAVPVPGQQPAGLRPRAPAPEPALTTPAGERPPNSKSMNVAESGAQVTRQPWGLWPQVTTLIRAVIRGSGPGPCSQPRFCLLPFLPCLSASFRSAHQLLVPPLPSPLSPLPFLRFLSRLSLHPPSTGAPSSALAVWPWLHESGSSISRRGAEQAGTPSETCPQCRPGLTPGGSLAAPVRSFQNNVIERVQRDAFCDPEAHRHTRRRLEDVRLDGNPVNLGLFPSAYFCLPRLPTGRFS